jgi:uncharacterized protein (TIGR03000 family)
MLRHLSLGWFSLACVYLAVAAAPAGAQEEGQRVTLRVRLPADAKLIVDGQETKQTGSLRRFYSPPLKSGATYHYTFEWTYSKNGDTVKRTKKIPVRAGDDKEVDLREEGEKEKALPDKGTRPDEPRPELEVPFVPTPPEVVDKMLELAGIKEGDVVYDLGCGDGRIVVAAAKKYGCKAFGFDLDPKRVKEARENVKKNGVEKLVTIEEKDLFKVDLKPASVVMMYLLPDVNDRLLPQLQMLKAGSRVVSHDFDLTGVKPKQTAQVESKTDGRSHKVYLWEAPLKKE